MDKAFTLWVGRMTNVMGFTLMIGFIALLLGIGLIIIEQVYIDFSYYCNYTYGEENWIINQTTDCGGFGICYKCIMNESKV